MESIKVFGHKSPDTDATASALVWAWFLNSKRKQRADAYTLGKPNTEAQFVLDYWKVEQPEILEGVNKDDRVAIVDTNNADELFENINEANIVSIIDHHKLTGGLKTDTPLEVIIQPYASTMTVMYNVMNIEPQGFPREIAGLMLSGIISDTLGFRSPTTTPDDHQLAIDLAATLDVDITEYASAMFEAKSDISHFTDIELLRLDSKILEIKGENLRISVLETTNPEMVLQRKDSIAEAIDQVCQEDHVQHVMLFVVDILKQEATVLVHNGHVKSMIEEGFDIQTQSDTAVLPGIVSRKKQIIPALSK